MAKIRIRYFTTRPGKNGTERYFWQPRTELIKAGWKIQRLSNNKTTALQEAERLNADLDKWRDGLRESPTNAKQGSIEALIQSFKNSHRWKDLAPKTQESYQYCLKIIMRWAGDAPARALTRKIVHNFYRSMYEKTPAKAAAVLRVLRLLLQYAVDEDILHDNPATKQRIKNTAKKGILWTPAAIKAFATTADNMGQHGHASAVILNEWLGQRMGDILNMSLASYQDGNIKLRQNKTGATVTLPVDIIPKIADRISWQINHNKNLPVVPTVLIAQANGQPFKKDWFAHLFAKIRAQAITEHPDVPELKDMIFKNLRHTAVTRMAESGCEILEIAAVTGHTAQSCQNIVDRYAIRTKKMAENAFRKRQTAEENQT
jgi:integrase